MLVEEKAGFKMHTHADFIVLVECIGNALHEHVSETTLERLWKYSTRHYKTVSLRTLDVLSEYCGYQSWDVFCEMLLKTSQIESEIIEEVLYSDSIPVGQKMKISWLPDRTIIIRHLGDGKFITIEATNSKIRPGDTFFCKSFTLGKELHMDKLSRAGILADNTKNLRYVVGKKNGITELELL